jgi:hypothetical protein
MRSPGGVENLPGEAAHQAAAPGRWGWVSQKARSRCVGQMLSASMRLHGAAPGGGEGARVGDERWPSRWAGWFDMGGSPGQGRPPPCMHKAEDHAPTCGALMHAAGRQLQ